MEGNSSKQLGGCSQVGASMPALHLAMALKMPSEEALVGLHMAWLLRVEIYLALQQEVLVLVYSLEAHNLEAEQAQLSNQVSSNSVLCLSLAASEVVLAPFSVRVQASLQMILMQILL
jgi:hypothetical protein